MTGKNLSSSTVVGSSPLSRNPMIDSSEGVATLTFWKMDFAIFSAIPSSAVRSSLLT